MIMQRTKGHAIYIFTSNEQTNQVTTSLNNELAMRNFSANEDDDREKLAFMTQLA